MSESPDSSRANQMSLELYLDAGAHTPARAHLDDIGLDICPVALLSQVGTVYYLATGVHVKPPPGYYVEVIARSSLSSRGWQLANGVGIVDPSYTDEIVLAVSPLDPRHLLSVESLLGQRIAQLVVRHAIQLPATIRTSPFGESRGGSGSTGSAP
jgi:dUTP pyrophosphatase